MMEHLIILLIAGLIAAARAASKSKQNSTPPTPTPRRPRPPLESEAERQRRFMEAVGLPPGAQLPPPVRPRPGTAGPLPQIPPQSAPATLRRIYTGVPQKVGPTAGAPEIRRVAPPAGFQPPAPAAPAPMAQVAPAAAISPITAAVQAATAARQSVAAASASVSQPATPVSALLLRLRDPDSIRQAIILREILGPPKALQPLAAGPAGPWMGR